MFNKKRLFSYRKTGIHAAKIRFFPDIITSLVFFFKKIITKCLTNQERTALLFAEYQYVAAPPRFPIWKLAGIH